MNHQGSEIIIKCTKWTSPCVLKFGGYLGPSYKELRLIHINRKSSNQSQVCSLLSLMYIVAIDIDRK